MENIKSMGWPWGPDVSAVEVKIDNGPWTKAGLDNSQSPYSWRSWHITQALTPGEHTVTSRAIDTSGKVQPAMDDPLIATKETLLGEQWANQSARSDHLRTSRPAALQFADGSCLGHNAVAVGMTLLRVCCWSRLPC